MEEYSLDEKFDEAITHILVNIFNETSTDQPVSNAFKNDGINGIDEFIFFDSTDVSDMKWEDAGEMKYLKKTK